VDAEDEVDRLVGEFARDKRYLINITTYWTTYWDAWICNTQSNASLSYRLDNLVICWGPI
jgi:hypothetical protein